MKAEFRLFRAGGDQLEQTINNLLTNQRFSCC